MALALASRTHVRYGGGVQARGATEGTRGLHTTANGRCRKMEEAPAVNDSVLMAKRAAQFLHVSAKTLLSLAGAGEISGRRVRWERCFVRADTISYVGAGAAR